MPRCAEQLLAALADGFPLRARLLRRSNPLILLFTAALLRCRPTTGRCRTGVSPWVLIPPASASSRPAVAAGERSVLQSPLLGCRRGGTSLLARLSFPRTLPVRCCPEGCSGTRVRQRPCCSFAGLGLLSSAAAPADGSTSCRPAVFRALFRLGAGGACAGQPPPANGLAAGDLVPVFTCRRADERPGGCGAAPARSFFFFFSLVQYSLRRSGPLMPPLLCALSSASWPCLLSRARRPGVASRKSPWRCAGRAHPRRRSSFPRFEQLGTVGSGAFPRATARSISAKASSCRCSRQADLSGLPPTLGGYPQPSNLIRAPPLRPWADRYSLSAAEERWASCVPCSAAPSGSGLPLSGRGFKKIAFVRLLAAGLSRVLVHRLISSALPCWASPSSPRKAAVLACEEGPARSRRVSAPRPSAVSAASSRWSPGPARRGTGSPAAPNAPRICLQIPAQPPAPPARAAGGSLAAAAVGRRWLFALALTELWHRRALGLLAASAAHTRICFASPRGEECAAARRPANRRPR